MPVAGITVLMLGDVVGQPGMRAVFYGLPALLEKHRPHLVIINAENAADGYGTLPDQAHQLLRNGVHVLTGGNHSWEKKEFWPLFSEPGVLRPANYSEKLPGSGYYLHPGSPPVAVINLQGRTRMTPIGDPFEMGMDLVQKARRQTPLVIVDFHAEASDEKEALALHLDGLASLVVGTHTHIPTSDERFFPKGTALLGDLGMCGSTSGVIGGSATASVARLLTGVPVKADPPDSELEIQGAVAVLDCSTGRVQRLERVRSRVF